MLETIPNSSVLLFPCIKCGACCRHIDQIPELSAYDLGNGVCKYLKENLCQIYHTRPEICRVDVMYDKYFQSFYSREEFYQLNLEGCKHLMQQEGNL